MCTILGADGYVGSTAANTLLQQGQPVTVVLHSAVHAEAWKQKGAEVAICDVNDTNGLRQIFDKGEQAEKEVCNNRQLT